MTQNRKKRTVLRQNDRVPPVHCQVQRHTSQVSRENGLKSGHLLRRGQPTTTTGVASAVWNDLVVIKVEKTLNGMLSQKAMLKRWKI